jgi:hypothetical protein
LANSQQCGNLEKGRKLFAILIVRTDKFCVNFAENESRTVGSLHALGLVGQQAINLSPVFTAYVDVR